MVMVQSFGRDMKLIKDEEKKTAHDYNVSWTEEDNFKPFDKSEWKSTNDNNKQKSKKKKSPSSDNNVGYIC